MFGLHQRSPSADLTANYPLEYVPCRRNSDGNGYGLRNNKKSKYIILNLLLSQDTAIDKKLITAFYINQKSIYIHVSLDRLIVAQETGDDEEVAFHIKTHPALKEFPPHYRNGFKLLVRK